MSVVVVSVHAGSLGRIHECDVIGFVEFQGVMDVNRPIDVMCCCVSGSLQSVQRERASLSSLAAPLAKLHALPSSREGAWSDPLCDVWLFVVLGLAGHQRRTIPRLWDRLVCVNPLHIPIFLYCWK
jgi:hypothetical protein